MCSMQSPTPWRCWARMCSAAAPTAAPLATLREHDELTGVPGIGKAISDKIAELLDTGQLQFYEKLRARVPAGVLELLRVPNIGPRTAGKLYTDLGIASIADLKAAAESGKLDKLKGFGS